MRKLTSVLLALLMLVTGMVFPAVAASEAQAADATAPEGFDILVTDCETKTGWIGYDTDKNGPTGRPAPTLTAMPGRGNVISYTSDGIMYAGGGWAGPNGNGKTPTDGIQLAYKAATPVNISTMNYFVFDIYVSHPEKIDNTKFYVELSSSGKNDVQENSIKATLSSMKGEALVVGWNRIYLDLSTLNEKTSPALDVTKWNFVRFYNQDRFDAGAELVLAFDNIGFSKEKHTTDLENFTTEFTLFTDSETPYYVSGGSKSGTTLRFMDKLNKATYKYSIEQLAKAESIVWSAKLSGQILLEVSVDGVNFETVYAYNVDLDTLIESGNNSGNSALAGHQSQNLPTAVRSYNLTEIVKDLATKNASDTLYIRLGDSYPYPIVKTDNGDGTYTYTEDTSSTFGCGYGASLYASLPVSLTVSYPWGTIVPTVTDSVSFTVLTDSETPYLYGDKKGSLYGGNTRFADKQNQFCYAYPVENIQNANKIIWTARTGGQLLLDVSTDYENWTEIYRFTVDPATRYQNQSVVRANSTDDWDITEAILKTATADTDTIYVRIRDAYPYEVDADGNDTTKENGAGGKVLNTAGGQTVPITLTVDYDVDHTAQTALGQKLLYTFTPTDSTETLSDANNPTLHTITTGTEYPYLYDYNAKARLVKGGQYYFFDGDGAATYAFPLEEGAVPSNMTFTAKMGERLGVWITFDDPTSANAVWESVKVTTPDEDAGWTTTTQIANKTRVLDLMPAYRALIAKGARNSNEHTLYLKIGHANSNGNSNAGNTWGNGGKIFKDVQAKFTCDYFWHPEIMPDGDALGVISAALTLTNDFGISYTALADAPYTDVNVRVGYADSVQKGVTPNVNGSSLSFSFENIPAHRLSDEIVTTVYGDYNGGPAIHHLTYSVRQYCENMMRAYASDDTLCTLLSDVLTYGAAAQNYASYKTNDLATNVSVALTPSTFNASLIKGERGVSGTKSELVEWSSANLELGTKMIINMIFTATDVSGLTVKVQIGDRLPETLADFELLDDGRYQISYEVMAHEFADTLTAEFYVGGAKIGRTLSYSVNGYINSTYASAPAKRKSLLEAIANYGLSVNAYVDEHPELLGAKRNEENVIHAPNTAYVTAAEYSRAVAYNTADTNLTLLQNVMNKAKAGEPITVATIGGSITHGSSSSDRTTKSYSALFRDWWIATFPNSTITHVNAGIGATTSHLGIHRLDDHVLAKNPDVCIVEFSVNDYGDAFYADTYESIVAKLLDNGVAVILQFMVKESGDSTQAVNVEIGKKYDLPMLSYGDAIFPTIVAGQRTWADISPDNIHPNDYGHAYMGEILWKFLNSVYAYTPNAVEVDGYDKDALKAAPYYSASLLGAIETSDTTAILPTLQGMFEIDENSVKSTFKGAWVANPTLASVNGSEMSFTMTFSKLGVMYTRTIDGLSGICEVCVDGTKVAELDGNFPNGWGNYQASGELFSSDVAAEHTVTFKMKDASKAFTLVRLLVTDYDAK